MSSYLPSSKAATIAAALAATVLLAPTSASAQQGPLFDYAEPSAIRTELVSFARLALTEKRDQQRLQRKVGAAVAQVCLRNVGHFGVEDRDYYACERSAWNAASPQIAAAISRATDMASNIGGLNNGTSIAVSAIRISAR